MGTNFYWKVADVELPTGVRVAIESLTEGCEARFRRGDPRVHIGKRSAAGLYCWDCGRTLCKGGEGDIHSGCSGWYKACPTCGVETAPLDGPRGVELGLAKPHEAKPTGVQPASSFSWCQDPKKVVEICEVRADEVLIVDEYGCEMTGREFLTMLECNCPIRFTHSIGLFFS